MFNNQKNENKRLRTKVDLFFFKGTSFRGYTVEKTAASSLIIAVGVFYVCRILQLFFDVFLTVYCALRQLHFFAPDEVPWLTKGCAINKNQVNFSWQFFVLFICQKKRGFGLGQRTFNNYIMRV